MLCVCAIRNHQTQAGEWVSVRAGEQATKKASERVNRQAGELPPRRLMPSSDFLSPLYLLACANARAANGRLRQRHSCARPLRHRRHRRRRRRRRASERKWRKSSAFFVGHLLPTSLTTPSPRRARACLTLPLTLASSPLLVAARRSAGCRSGRHLPPSSAAAVTSRRQPASQRSASDMKNKQRR